MRLTLHTDYALRTLLYLGSHPDELVPVSRIAGAYGISAHHVAKVAKALVKAGYVDARRGPSGGLRLAREPVYINVGEVVERMEPDLVLLECMDAKTNTCALRGVCELERVVVGARDAFFRELQARTLADLLERSPKLVRILDGRRS